MVRVLGHNQLVWPNDRIEGFVLVLGVVVAVMAVTIAAAVGTSAHDARSRVYAEQALAPGMR